MILSPTLTLSAGSGAAIVRPTFSRDFAGERTLNNGTGPAITFTRASGATFFDANGVLQTAANDVPRFDHSQDGAANSLGLLIEEARTNSIRNAQGGGSTNGVIGSGGAVPTNWLLSGHNINGITTEVIGTGTENGLSYLDIKFSGTPTGNDNAQIHFDGLTQAAALGGQTWTSSAYVKLVGGSLTNTTCVITVLNYGPTTTFIGGATTPFTPTSASLATQRQSRTHTLSGAATASVVSTIRASYASGDPIDITLRIAAPQLEQGAFPTSYIPTTTVAVQRLADSAVVTPISGFYNASEGTLFADYRVGAGTPVAGVLVVDDGTNDNRVGLFLGVAQVAIAATFTGVGAISATANTVFKTVLGYKANDHAASISGAAVTTNTAVGVPSGLTTLGIGAEAGGTLAQPCGHIRRIAYYPKRLSNALLQSLTT